MEYPAVRHMFFVFMIFAILATFFCGVVLISASADTNVVMDLSWSHGSTGRHVFEKGDSFEVYLSMHNIVTAVESEQNSQSTFSSAWANDSCVSDFCSSCDDAMQAVFAFALLTFVFSFISIYTNFLRATEFGNTPRNYRIGAYTSVASVVSSLICVVVFTMGCRTKVQSDPNNSSVDWSFGPSFYLMIGVLVFKSLDLIGNSLMSYGNYRLKTSSVKSIPDYSDPVMPPGVMTPREFAFASSMHFEDNPMMLHSRSPRLKCADPSENMSSLMQYNSLNNSPLRLQNPDNMLSLKSPRLQSVDPRETLDSLVYLDF